MKIKFTALSTQYIEKGIAERQMNISQLTFTLFFLKNTFLCFPLVNVDYRKALM